MAKLKFYKSASTPADAAAGAIWFDTTNHTIQLKTATGWDKYAGALNDATWSNNTLTITKHDGSSIALDFSDMASATAMKQIFTGKIGLDENLGYTPVYTGNANVKADIASAKSAIEAVIGDDTDEATDITIYGTRKYVDGKVDAINVTGDNQYITVTAKGENNDTFLVSLTQSAATQLDSKTTVNAKADGHVLVSVSSGFSGDTVTITENDIASAKDLDGVADRVSAIETVLGDVEDPNNNVIDRISEVIAYFNGVAETETGAALLETVAGHTTDITNLQNNTVNGKKISENPVLAGSDVLLTGYTEQTAAALDATDSINVALGKLEARVDAAAAGGVQSVGGKAGSITLDTDATGEGNVKFAISDAGEISATVNIGATAAQGAKADSAIQNVVEDATTFSEVSVENHIATVKNKIVAVASASQTDNGLATAYDVQQSISSALEWATFE